MRAKLIQKILRKVYVKFTESTESSKTYPGGPILGYFVMLDLFFKLFCLQTVFFQLLHTKPCRIIWKFRQNTILGPETCEIGPKVLRKVYVNFTESLRKVYGIFLGPIWAHIRAHKGPYGPQPGLGPNPGPGLDANPTLPTHGQKPPLLLENISLHRKTSMWFKKEKE